MANFMSLPREIRDMIYHYSLTALVPLRYIPRPTKFRLKGISHSFDSTKDSPNLALLRASKCIHDEATCVWYGNNAFKLPRNLAPMVDLALKQYAPRVRHAYITYDLVRLSPTKVKLAHHLDRTTIRWSSEREQVFMGWFLDKDRTQSLLDRLTALKTLTVEVKVDRAFVSRRRGGLWKKGLEFLEECLSGLTKGLLKRDPPVKLQVFLPEESVYEGTDEVKRVWENLRMELLGVGKTGYHPDPWWLRH